MAIGGFPCQPYSPMRHKSGQTAGTGSVEGHPQYATLHVEFVEYLCARQPVGFIVEEVDGILKTARGSGGKSHLDLFVLSLKKESLTAKYAVKALTLDHGVFSEMPRNRVFIIGLEEESGGADALQTMVDKIKEVQPI